MVHSSISHLTYMKALNQEQLEIVVNGNGPVLVIAGPGSGKTRTLVSRVCHILQVGAVRPENILLLTFTNKAAREMISRAEELAGPHTNKIMAGTFHHFANILLRRHCDNVGIRPNFTILDEDDARHLLKQAMSEHYENTKKGLIDQVAHLLSLSKLKMSSLEELVQTPEFFHLRAHTSDIELFSASYIKLKRSMNVLDFDDLLYFLHKLLHDNPTIRSFYQKVFTHILVDEFQDTDRLQDSILSLLYSKGNDLMVVGDDSQSIYSFRGAEIKNILQFRDKYFAKTFLLTSNYRSTPPIISVINKCMESSKVKLDKSLVSVSHSDSTGKSSLPIVMGFQDRESEARLLAEQISVDLSAGLKVGVLFRAAYLSSDLEVELSRRGVEYDMRGGVKFLEQKHIKDLVSSLKAFNNPHDSTAVLRLLTLFPRVGEKRVKDILSKPLQSPSEVVSALSKLDKSGVHSAMLDALYSSASSGKINAAGMLDGFYSSFYNAYLKDNFDDYEERIQDVDALVSAATKYQTVQDFLSAFSLDTDSPKVRNCPLVLSTIHQAKGLEWDSVFVIGLADGLLPHERSSDIEEERRLFYVAISRAKTKLVMSYPATTGRFYGSFQFEPSRFITELPDSLYSRIERTMS